MSLSKIVMNSGGFELVKESRNGAQLWVMKEGELDGLKVADAMRLQDDFSEEGDAGMNALKTEFADKVGGGEVGHREVKLRFMKDGVEFVLGCEMVESGKEFFLVSETDSRVYFFKVGTWRECEIVFGSVATVTDDFETMAGIGAF